jgi:flavin-dependent dehydrogenase
LHDFAEDSTNSTAGKKTMKTVGIIGGGPAGSACALTLARGGARVLLFEREPDREKPCGGGLTARAFRALPELARLDLPWAEAREFHLVGPTGRRACLTLDPPIRIVSRRILDRALRRLAEQAGAQIIPEHVADLARAAGGGWEANGRSVDVLVGAGGMNDPLARLQNVVLTRDERATAVGRFVRGNFAPCIVVRFFPDQRGYAWWFPRPDHASLGIELAGEHFDKELAWKLLRQFAAEDLPGVDITNGEDYGWSGPAVTRWDARVFGGPDWLLVGDAAGLADVTTGEGISYALASGKLAAECILCDDVGGYPARLHESLVPELAKSARLHPKLYRGWVLRLSILALTRSRTWRTINAETAHGFQSYLTLKRRVYRALPRVIGEVIIGT